MFSILSSHKEHDLLLTVGSGSVAGAVVELQKNDRPKILVTSESIFPVKEGTDGEHIANHMLSALHAVIRNIRQEHPKRIKNVHVTFASPWFSSFSQSVNIKKDEVFMVTEKSIEKILADHLKDLSDKTANNNESGKAPATIIEKSVSQIRLNGYETPNPYGKSAKNLDVTMYISSIPTVLHEKIESEIYTAVHPAKIICHSLPFAAWSVILKLFSPKEDFVFIDVGSEVTDVLITKQGVIQSVISFPIGQNHLLRKAALFFETEPELAASMINLYASDTVEEATKEKTRTLVSAFSEEWLLKFTHAVQETDSGQMNYIPQKSFFVSEQNLSPIFNDIIKKQIPSTIALSRESISDFVDFVNNGASNIFIALSAIYVNSRF